MKPFHIEYYFSEPAIAMGLLAFIFILIALPISFWKINQNSSSPLVRFLIASANFVLTAQLIIRWWESGHFPISNLYESLCFLTWAFTLIQLLLEKILPSKILQATLTPISLISIAFASFALPEELQAASPLVPALRSSWLIMHVSVIMCSYAALILGSLLAIPILIDFRKDNLQLRSSSIGVGGFREKINTNNERNSIVGLAPIIFSKSEEIDIEETIEEDDTAEDKIITQEEGTR